MLKISYSRSLELEYILRFFFFRDLKKNYSYIKKHTNFPLFKVKNQVLHIITHPVVKKNLLMLQMVEHHTLEQYNLFNSNISYVKIFTILLDIFTTTIHEILIA